MTALCSFQLRSWDAGNWRLWDFLTGRFSCAWLLCSRGLPPPQQQQMLSLRATNQASLLSANPMLQRALLLQQMQGTVIVRCSLNFFRHPFLPTCPGTEGIGWAFLVKASKSLGLAALSVCFFLFKFALTASHRSSLVARNPHAQMLLVKIQRGGFKQEFVRWFRPFKCRCWENFLSLLLT